MPKVADVTTCPDSVVYQLRVVINGVSPLIWRRLLVPGQTTIARLHTILQTVFGWGGEHLHRFVIHGSEYGIYQVGGPWFRDDARQVRLGELGLRLGEKFTYTYNYCAAWTCDLRVEQITDAQPGRTYPYCVGGHRAGPPEEWEGPWAFVEQTQPYLVFEAMLRAAEIVGQLLDADPDDELASLLPLLGLEQFDRRACNTALTGERNILGEAGWGSSAAPADQVRDQQPGHLCSRSANARPPTGRPAQLCLPQNVSLS